MLSADQEASLLSAVKLVRMIITDTELPWNKKAEADESLRRLLYATVGVSDLPDLEVYRRREAA